MPSFFWRDKKRYMTTKQLDTRVKHLERSTTRIKRQMRQSTSSKPSGRSKILKAMKAVEGMWKDNPRTNEDLKKLRKRLGY